MENILLLSPAILLGRRLSASHQKTQEDVCVKALPPHYHYLADQQTHRNINISHGIMVTVYMLVIK
jgi:hypothetical protein